MQRSFHAPETHHEARNPVAKKLGFRIHALAFVPGLIALVALNLLTGPPYWIQWVLLGWSIGLFCHWFFVLGPGAARSRPVFDEKQGDPT